MTGQIADQSAERKFVVSDSFLERTGSKIAQRLASRWPLNHEIVTGRGCLSGCDPHQREGSGMRGKSIPAVLIIVVALAVSGSLAGAAQLAQGPVITVPTITLEGKKFSGLYEHWVVNGGIGHDLPQEALQAFPRPSST